eukprot:g2276.t1
MGKGNVKELKSAYKKARSLWKVNKEDAALKKAYKAAKRKLREAEQEKTRNAETEDAGGSSKEITQRDHRKSKALMEALEKAKAAWKADRSNKALRKAFLDAKKAAHSGSTDETKKVDRDSTPDKKDDETADAVCKVFCSHVPLDIDDSDTSKFFSDCGNIVDTYWLYDKKTGSFRGSGFVTFDTHAAATKACSLSGTMWKENAVKIEFARPMASWNGKMHSGKSCGIYCGNLPSDIDKATLVSFFADCGTITDISWRENEDGTFKRCAFLLFDSVKSAGLAWKKDGCMLSNHEIVVKPRRPIKTKKQSGEGRETRAPLGPRPDGCLTCFVGNLAFEMSEDAFVEFAGPGMLHVRWLTEQDSGKFKGCGFVDFETSEATEAFAKKNGTVFCGRPIRIDYAPKSKRDAKPETGNGDDASW